VAKHRILVAAALACICSGTWSANADFIESDSVTIKIAGQDPVTIISGTTTGDFGEKLFIENEFSSVRESANLTVRMPFLMPIGFHSAIVFLFEPSGQSGDTDDRADTPSDFLEIDYNGTDSNPTNILHIFFISTGHVFTLEFAESDCMGAAPGLPRAFCVDENPSGNSLGTFFGLNPPNDVFVLSNDRLVPSPVMGAGLPGLLLASGALLAWRRRRQRTA
jgi:hypothetical protein